MDDRSIVKLYWLRDESALKQTAEVFGSRLRKLAYGIVRDEQTAEECENDTYLAAWNSIPPHRPEGYLYAFLARITRHLALNCCRDRSRLKRSAAVCQLSVELEQCIPAADDTARWVDDDALTEILDRFLGGLDVEKRRIFVRRYWYLDSVEEIAGHFGLSQSKVKTTLYRCRKRLREQLETEGYKL